MIFRALFEKESSTYTYLLGDPESREAVIIDSVRETLDRDLEQLSALKLKLKWILETHVHADHVTGAWGLKQKTGAQIALCAASGVKTADRLLADGDEIPFGSQKIQVIGTPGHTNSCLSFYVSGRVFTGDALLVRGCGRTDFQEGSNEILFRSVREKLFALPPDTIVHPGHDYKGRHVSSIEEERRLNPRLGDGKTFEEFSAIMDGLGLAPPKKIKEALPANLKLGAP